MSNKNDELLERLGELLDFKGPVQLQRFSHLPDGEWAVRQIENVHAIVRRIRHLIGVHETSGQPSHAASLLRETLK